MRGRVAILSAVAAFCVLSSPQARSAPQRKVNPQPVPASIEDVLGNPLNVTTIGITASPGFADGKYQVTVTVDLHDVHFEMQNDRHVGTLALSFADDALVQTETLKLSYTDAELAAALEHGLMLSKTREQKSAVRIVARDAATGAVGSLWVAPPEK